MNVFEFLYSLGFWQWIGVLPLSGGAGSTLVGVAAAFRGKGTP